ncbi:hypothetical protein C8J57DRAFT_1250011 [Mycena rebaudengoi]|nr:hypothetical protein C8J57DRAFT_1250011 [Mycena rebaudengoi]
MSQPPTANFTTSAPTPSPEDMAKASEAAEAELQRTLLEWVQTNITCSVVNGGGKKRRAPSSENTPPNNNHNGPANSTTYHWYSCNLIRNCRPFIQIANIVEDGAHRELEDPPEYHAPVAYVEIQKGMVGARSDDTAALKWTIVEFLTSPALTTPIEPAMPLPGPTALLAMPAPTALPAMPAKTGTTNTLVPAAVAKLPLPPCGLKAGCGFNHSKTAEQLCPIHIEAMTEYSACHQPL